MISCYEAGYDGFWLHRSLEERGVRNHVIDPANLQVNRRARGAKTDRIDLERLFGVAATLFECGRTRIPPAETRIPAVHQADHGVERCR